MSVKIKVPLVGDIEVQSFNYANGRKGFVARKVGQTEGFFNLSLNIEGVHIDYIILKEYGDAQLVNKFLLESNVFHSEKTADIGFNKCFYTNLMRKSWAD